MAQKLIATLLAVTGLATAFPAAAQDDGSVSAPSPSPASGYRIDNSDAGFELVTHGVWRTPEPLPLQPGSAATVPGNPSGIVRQGPKRLQGAAPNFRRAAYLPHVQAAEAQYGLPAGLLDALIWTESRYNPFAISGAGAAGLGQLMPKTARELGVANRFDPRANLWAAARYLRQMLDKFGMVHLAVAAYNAGPGAVERAGGIPLNGETPSYVRNVLAFWGAR
ncbi:lytic transglycosylase domain-containing protein [Novosphingobium aquiterrae]|uniref:Lytic transglycosylase domain-containing protein n=1 Tax=Novosphingobium aquiterrae TaxID=624388 RepID=A0ABV6PM35_9SPHN